jgi:outer membrane protein assembly factor BamE (lipoprotein component of BamABCDE complex)
MNLRRYTAYLFFALSSVLLISACDTDPKWVLRSRESEKYSFTRFLENIGNFPYTANQSKVSRVRKGFRRLSLGMRKDDVRKIMGAPDAEMLNYKSKQESEELVDSTWAYYLKRFERNLANEGFDEVLVLYFKPNEELYWADPDNIAGLKPLGGPELYPNASIPSVNR